MYNTDKPIKNVSEDILGRQSFSRHLAEAIIALEKSDNVTIGLYGRWGTGKTSIYKYDY